MKNTLTPQEILRSMTQRERWVLHRRVVNECTLQETASELRTSRGRVRQIEAKALRKLRSFFDNRDELFQLLCPKFYGIMGCDKIRPGMIFDVQRPPGAGTWRTVCPAEFGNPLYNKWWCRKAKRGRKLVLFLFDLLWNNDRLHHFRWPEKTP